MKLSDCTTLPCAVTLYLRGYDPKGRLRYVAEADFKGLSIGEHQDTNFDSAERLYFSGHGEANPDTSESVTFTLF